MTEAEQIELLRRENASLRQRVEALELAKRDLAFPTASTPAPDGATALAQRFELLFAQSPISIFETSTDRRTRLWNQSAERVFGYSESEMLGRNPYEVLLDARDQNEITRSSAEIRAKGWTRTILPAKTKDGRQILCSWVVTYLTDAAGQVVGMACFGRDVTQELANERARQESEAVLAATFDTAAVGLCSIDERGHFLRVNSAYCQMYGWSSAELIGQHFSVVIPPAMREWTTQGYTKLIQSDYVGLMPTIEMTIARRDQRPLTIAATYTMLSLEGGRRIQVSAVADVTERNAQAAEQQQRMHDAQREAAEKTRLLAELDQKLDVIARQHQQILDLSAPVLDIWDGVLLLPLIGQLDGRRVSAVTELLLQAVAERRTRYAILDMTSLELLDTTNASHIGTMVQALRLLGVRSIITGIRPATAQTMVQMGVDLQGVATVRDLQQGLLACIDLTPRSPRKT